jgi:hypothetical protein
VLASGFADVRVPLVDGLVAIILGPKSVMIEPEDGSARNGFKLEAGSGLAVDCGVLDSKRDLLEGELIIAPEL